MSFLMRRLERHWCAQHITSGSGAPDGDLLRFEARHRVVLPVDFRAYLRQLNGMAVGQSDDAGLSFWPLTHIMPLRDMEGGATVPGAEHLFIFAAGDNGAYAFAVSLTGDLNNPAPVFVINQASRQVAARFAEFIERYLADDPGVLFPRPTP